MLRHFRESTRKLVQPIQTESFLEDDGKGQRVLYVMSKMGFFFQRVFQGRNVDTLTLTRLQDLVVCLSSPQNLNTLRWNLQQQKTSPSPLLITVISALRTKFYETTGTDGNAIIVGLSHKCQRP